MMNTLKTSLGMLLCALCLFINTASAGTWNGAVEPGTKTEAISFTVIDPVTPTTIYMGAGGGLFKSIDSGASWLEVNIGAIPSSRILFLEIDPVTSSTLYVGTDSSGIFKSLDAGASWSAINTGLAVSDLYVGDIVISPLLPSTMYITTGYTPYTAIGKNIYKSIDGGASWMMIHTALSHIQAIAMNPLSPSILYIVENYAVSKSIDSGLTWSTLIIIGVPPATSFLGVCRTFLSNKSYKCCSI